MASFHTKFALLIFNTWPCPDAKQQLQATSFFSMSKFNVKLLLLLIFLFENMVKVQNFLHTFCWLIKSAVFCIFHFIPRMFCSFTQHCRCLYIFPFSGLRSCWSECLGSACSTTFGAACQRKGVNKSFTQSLKLYCNIQGIWCAFQTPKHVSAWQPAKNDYL